MTELDQTRKTPSWDARLVAWMSRGSDTSPQQGKKMTAKQSAVYMALTLGWAVIIGRTERHGWNWVVVAGAIGVAVVTQLVLVLIRRRRESKPVATRPDPR